ncbi:MAG: molybdenum cofactor guanylyltransferase [Deltaproteobacteria bacterium]|nr:molybdenum cofactor guanylyltransferase [Deltaproteobacteria bacterium]
MKYPYTGIILAGGMNRRMDGRNKALLSLGEQPIVGRLIELFQDLFEQVILVTNQPLEFVAWECMIVSDLLPVRSSLTGIHAGLFYTRNSHAFIAACDMPFLKKEMVQLLLNNLEPNRDVIVPVTREGYQPLCAVYSKRCLKAIERQTSNGNMKISKLYAKLKVKEIAEESLRQVDPDLISFFNINTEEDWTLFQKMRVSLNDGRSKPGI